MGTPSHTPPFVLVAAFGLDTHPPDTDGPPLAWLGVFDEPRVFRPPLPELIAPPPARWVPALDAARYGSIVTRLHERIAAGDCYQANLTFPLATTLGEEPFALFVRLAAVQRPRHAAYLDLGRFAIVSASPELFFRRDGQTLTTRPMKGTAARGCSPEEDERHGAEEGIVRVSDLRAGTRVWLVSALRGMREGVFVG